MRNRSHRKLTIARISRVKTARAVAARTVEVAADKARAEERTGISTPPITVSRKQPVITISVYAHELVIVVPGYNRVAIATAHALVAQLGMLCDDEQWAWIESHPIVGRGDKLETCTAVRVLLRDGMIASGAWNRARALGDLALTAACRAVAVPAGKRPAFDATMILHEPAAHFP